MRRTQYLDNKQTEEEHIFTNGLLKIDYISQSVFVADEEIHLMPIEYNLLCLLAKNVGKVLTHQYILDKVWVNAIESDLSSLRVYLTSLRKKIEKKSHEKYIQTHIGVGYKMVHVTSNRRGIRDMNNTVLVCLSPSPSNIEVIQSAYQSLHKKDKFIAIYIIRIINKV